MTRMCVGSVCIRSACTHVRTYVIYMSACLYVSLCTCIYNMYVNVYYAHVYYGNWKHVIFLQRI